VNALADALVGRSHRAKGIGAMTAASLRFYGLGALTTPVC
jgi:hypothetical protein